MIDWSMLLNWFIDHGIRILGILVMGVILWLPMRRFLRPIIRHGIVRKKGESAKGVEKRDSDDIPGSIRIR